jgi:hypothetical protein
VLSQMKTLQIGLAALVAVAVYAPAASAATYTTTCPGDGLSSRVFSITINEIGASCLDFGEGNINGNPNGGNPDPFLTGPEGTDYILVDKSDNGSGFMDGALGGDLSGGVSGVFTIHPDVYTNLKNIAIAFKSGGVNSGSPDWAVFLLPAGTLGGNWTITGAQQALSHGQLYGQVCLDDDQGCTPPDTNVPEPVTLALLGLGLAGAAFARRRQ